MSHNLVKTTSNLYSVSKTFPKAHTPSSPPPPQHTCIRCKINSKSNDLFVFPIFSVCKLIYEPYQNVEFAPKMPDILVIQFNPTGKSLS